MLAKPNDSPKIIGFIPALRLRVVTIKAPKIYRNLACLSVFLGLIHVMIGAVNMAALVYSVQVGDSHAAICTVAYHFFTAEAILCLTYANGWSRPLLPIHKKCVHVFLQICGTICGVVGITLVTMLKGLPQSAHGFTGIIAGALGIAGLLTGTCAVFNKKVLKIFHITIGVTTFILSSVSICLGLFTSSFRGWADISIVIVVMFFVIFYTIFIIISLLINRLSS